MISIIGISGHIHLHMEVFAWVSDQTSVIIDLGSTVFVSGQLYKDEVKLVRHKTNLPVKVLYIK